MFVCLFVCICLVGLFVVCLWLCVCVFVHVFVCWCLCLVVRCVFACDDVLRLVVRLLAVRAVDLQNIMVKIVVEFCYWLYVCVYASTKFVCVVTWLCVSLLFRVFLHSSIHSSIDSFHSTHSCIHAFIHLVVGLCVCWFHVLVMYFVAPQVSLSLSVCVDLKLCLLGAVHAFSQRPWGELRLELHTPRPMRARLPGSPTC